MLISIVFLIIFHYGSSLECQSPFLLTSSSTCAENCPNGFYIKNNKCLKCQEGCDECQLQECLNCSPGYSEWWAMQANKKVRKGLQELQLFSDNGKSKFQATFTVEKTKTFINSTLSPSELFVWFSDGKEFESTLEFLCVYCQSPCKDCQNIITGKDTFIQKCTSCQSGFGINAQFSDGSVSCEPCLHENCEACFDDSSFCEKCEAGFAILESDGTCIQTNCESNCDVCVFREGKTTCDKCSERYFLNSTKCSGCSGNCSNCESLTISSGSSSTIASNCINCDDGYALYTNGFINQCKKCPEGCLSCSFGSNSETECHECGNGFFYIDGECSLCTSDCFFCSTESECWACLSDFYLLEETNTCVSECPKSHYLDGQSCVFCDENCEKCSAQTRKCLVCNQNTANLNGNCIDECPELQMYFSDGYCLDCHSSCLKCNGWRDSECLSCQMGKFFIGGRCILEGCPQSTTENCECSCGSEEFCYPIESFIGGCSNCSKSSFRSLLTFSPNSNKNVSVCAESNIFNGFWFSSRIDKKGYIEYIEEDQLIFSLFLFQGLAPLSALPGGVEPHLFFDQNSASDLTQSIEVVPASFYYENEIVLNSSSLFKGNPSKTYLLSFFVESLAWNSSIFFKEGGFVAEPNLTVDYGSDSIFVNINITNVLYQPQCFYSIEAYAGYSYRRELVYKAFSDNAKNTAMEVSLAGYIGEREILVLIRSKYFLKEFSLTLPASSLSREEHQSSAISEANRILNENPAPLSSEKAVELNALTFPAMGAFQPFEVDLLTRDVRLFFYESALERYYNTTFGCDEKICPLNGLCQLNQENQTECVCQESYIGRFCSFDSEETKELAKRISKTLLSTYEELWDSPHILVGSIYIVVALNLLLDDPLSDYDYSKESLMLYRQLRMSELPIIQKFVDASYLLFLSSKLGGAQDHDLYFSSFQIAVQQIIDIGLCWQEDSRISFEEDDYSFSVWFLESQNFSSNPLAKTEVNGVQVEISFEIWLQRSLQKAIERDPGEKLALFSLFGLSPYLEGMVNESGKNPAGSLMYSLRSCLTGKEIEVSEVLEDSSDNINEISRFQLCFDATSLEGASIGSLDQANVSGTTNSSYSLSYLCAIYQKENEEYSVENIEARKDSGRENYICCKTKETGYFTVFAVPSEETKSGTKNKGKRLLSCVSLLIGLWLFFEDW